MTPFRPRMVLIAILILTTVMVYLPITGHTLKTDDFSRIQDNSHLSADYFRTLFSDNKSDGFFRPLNHLSFGLTYHFFGMNPRAYGALNFLLLLGSVYFLFRVVEHLSSDSFFAWLLVIGWLANVKLVSSVLTWAVGRTTAMYAFFLLCAIFSLIKTPKWNVWLCISLSSLCTLLALFSKESAVVAFPLLMATLMWQKRTTDRITYQHIAGLAVTLMAAYGLYFFLRHQSLAMTPSEAPSYYKWNISPLFLLNNARGYLERSLILSIVVIPAFWAIMPRNPREQSALLLSRKFQVAFWLLGFIITIGPMLPVPSKSNLYAYFPSIFVVGALVTLCKSTSRWPDVNHLPVKRILFVTILILGLALPVSWVRGLASYRHNRHVLDWSRTISSTLKSEHAKTIVINFDTQEFTQTKLSPLDFTFLEMSLHLHGVNVRVVTNPQHPASDWPTFDLIQYPDHERIGRLLYKDRANNEIHRIQ